MSKAETTYTPTSWNLGDLFPAHDSSEMDKAFEKLDKAVAKFEKLRSKLKPDIKHADFIDILKQSEDIALLAYRVQQFAGLWFSENTQNQEAQSFQAKVQQLLAELQNRTLFFDLWWKGLDDENAARLVKDSEEFKYYLEQMRNFKPYTLSEPEEKIINIKNVTGAQAMVTLYESITNRYTFKIEVDGEEKELTQGELMNLVFSPDADLRKRAYQELFRVFKNDAPILGQIYQNRVRDWRNENIDLRKYKAPISVRNLSNDIPDEVVETLMEVSRKNAGVFQRYFKLKAKLLGMDKLRRYDIYAPVASTNKKYDYDYAVKLTMNVFKEFDNKVAEYALRVFADGHIDSEIRKGKQSGAFCSSSNPGFTPYVLMNYVGSANDIATLAHELGHAIHALMGEKHNVFAFHSSLPLAETASTFSEMLLVDQLLEEEPDEDVRRDILFNQVSDAYATIGRQIFFAMFERNAHKAILEGASVDEIAEVYQENLKQQFGDSLELPEDFKWEWVYVWHFYGVPFYVYAYSFGQLLVLSLYQRYKEEGDAFKPSYLEILTAGGSMSPDEILTKAGVDMRSAKFWQGGFDVIGRMIDELEAITSS